MLMLRGGIEPAFGEVPQQLDDRTFWKLVSDISESGGIFPSENVVSNEANFQLVLNKLKERTGIAAK